jgi:hypothetical protein
MRRDRVVNLSFRPGAWRTGNKGEDLLPSEQFCSVYDWRKDHYWQSNKLGPLDLLFGGNNHFNVARRGRHSEVVLVFRCLRCGDAGGTWFDCGPVF